MTNDRGTGSAALRWGTAVRARLIGGVYADHNSSAAVRSALHTCLRELGPEDRALNVGSGTGRLHPQVVNLDIVPGRDVDMVASAEQIPCRDDEFALLISQETLEHVEDPWRAVGEMFRVTEPGGRLYLQVPFVIGYHPGPTDYWRFTRDGARALAERSGFDVEHVGTSVGPAVGMYRVTVEFLATVLAAVSPRLYYPAKGVAAFILYPLKLLDPLLRTQRDRIAGGYYVIATKPRSDGGHENAAHE